MNCFVVQFPCLTVSASFFEENWQQEKWDNYINTVEFVTIYYRSAI